MSFFFIFLFSVRIDKCEPKQPWLGFEIAMKCEESGKNCRKLADKQTYLMKIDSFRWNFVLQQTNTQPNRPI